MKRKELSYNDWLAQLYPEDAMNEEFCRNVTFQVCTACTLRCKYCYQSHDDHACETQVMTKETAKECVDMLFKMWDEDDKEAFINKNTKAIILDFIGGEPMLQTEIIDYICSYMVKESVKRDCPWKDNWMCSISTNGTLHFKKEVQDFLKKFEGHISYGVSIDGDKDIHDACRVYPDGSGSWEDATRAQQDYNKNHPTPSGTKATICQATIPKIDKIVKYFID